MRNQRDFLISPTHRGLHQGQRSKTALTGRTYDRIVPEWRNVRKKHLPAGPFHIWTKHFERISLAKADSLLHFLEVLFAPLFLFIFWSTYVPANYKGK